MEGKAALRFAQQEGKGSGGAQLAREATHSSCPTLFPTSCSTATPHRKNPKSLPSAIAQASMAAKRRAGRPRSDSSKKLARKGGGERLKKPPPASPEDSGAQGSSEASPARGGVALNTKTTPSKRLKKPPPASQEEDSGDASPERGGRLPDDSADAGHDNKTPATRKRGEKRSSPPRQGDERPEKRAAGPDADTVAAKPPKRKNKKSKRSAAKDRLNKEKKKQLRKALTKPMSPPRIAQEDEHHGREMTGQEQSNTSPPQDERRAREEEQQENEIAEQEHAGGTSPPHDMDMHSARGEEQQEKEVVNQERADDTSHSPPKDNHSVDEEEQPKHTSPPQEKNGEQEDEETGAQVNGKALQVNAPSTKLRGSETEKKPAAERSWSYDDELKILNALVEHAQSHDGALPDSSDLLANITFDKIDANEEKLTDKIRKLKARYRRMLSQGCPSDRVALRLFKLSEKLWGQVDEDEQVEPRARDFSALSKLYPHLAKEVKAYAEAHSSGDLIMAMFMTIGDQKARDLDAKCKKQQMEAFKLELGQASLIDELLSALSSSTRVKF